MLKASYNSSIKFFISCVAEHKISSAILMIYCIFTGAIPVIDSILLENITNLIESSIKDQTNLRDMMIYWAIIYAGWWQIINLLARVNDYIYLKTLPLIKGKILNDMYDYVQYHHHKFFQDNLAGSITNKISEASRSFEIIFSSLNEKIIHKISIITFTLLAMYHVHYKIALIFLSWICFFMVINTLYARKMSDYSSNYGKKKSLVVGRIVDAIANISAVRMFTSHKFENQYLGKHVEAAVKSEQSMQWFMLKLRNVLGISCSFMIFGIIYYLAILRANLEINIGECVLVISLCASVVDEIWDLTQEIGDIFEEFGNFSQSISLVKPHLIKDLPDAKSLEITKGEICFKNVTFSYKYNGNLFKNQSVKIEGGQKVGLVGFSGSGKTTFVNLVTRLYDIASGEILIDGQNIQSLTQESLRQNISIIPQEPILFHRTIMENIRYGNKNASRDDALKAAKLAHIDGFISDLSEGYDSICGERGNNLSGGQRQRIVIARAILKNAPILILDEATSSLDSNTESAIQESLQYLMHNKTVIIIAHRLSTLLDMDRILVFEKGMIVGDGRHSELLKTNKLYQSLWHSQHRIV